MPRLAPGWAEFGGELSPQESFLLSRIDGATPWHTLRQIGGLPPEEADACLERWLAEGLVHVEAKREPERRRPTAAPGPAAAVDESLELPVEVQRRVLELEARPDASYHELLGVARGDGEREIKRAYFQLSKIFHPDRYYGRNLGGFAPRLDRVFKRVALAYELLMDPATRRELERSLDAAPPPAPSEPEPASAPGAPPRKPSKREVLERLRRQFRIPDKVLAERRFKARQFHDAALVAEHQGKWTEAASCIRLAISFDPWNDEYKSSFGNILAQLNRLRAEELLREASGALDTRSRQQAARLLEEALGFRPSDARIHARLAQVSFELEDFDTAREHAQDACELAPDVAAHHIAHHRALRALGLREKANAALDEARRLAPEDPVVQEELRRARQKPRRR